MEGEADEQTEVGAIGYVPNFLEEASMCPNLVFI